MKLPLLFLIQILTVTSSMDIVDKTQNVVRADFPLYKGFPFAITCDQFDFLDFDTEAEGSVEDQSYPYDDNTVQCVVSRDDTTLQNETFVWEDVNTRGIFGTADETWNNAKVSVLVIWDAGPSGGQQFILTVNVINPNTYNCSNVVGKTLNESPELGKEHSLLCFAPLTMSVNEGQYDTITTVWYHNCKRIERDDPNFEYGNVDFFNDPTDGIELKSLKIRNATLSTAPGDYYCAMKTNGLELPLSGYKECLKEPFKPNLPIIVPGQEEYKAKPGSSLNVTCSGHTGAAPNSVSKHVSWYKYENVDSVMTAVLKCSNILLISSTGGNCSSILHENKEYCAPLTAEEIANTANDELDDFFIATFTLRDLTVADSGTHVCELVTTSGRIQKNFTVTVENNIEVPKNDLQIALGVVGGCIVVAIILILLFHIFMTPILYFLKHCFAPYETRVHEFITYMVYTPDAWNMENNMVDDTYKYFDQLNHPVYDPNKHHDHAGAPVEQQILKTLKKCMTAVIFITPDLLQLMEKPSQNNNDDNNQTREVYKCLENNVVNLNMRLVFICSKSTKQFINIQAGKKNIVCVLLLKFMGRRGNTVITWRPHQQTAFHRALYVALPKLQRNEDKPEVVIYNVAL